MRKRFRKADAVNVGSTLDRLPQRELSREKRRSLAHEAFTAKLET